MNDEYTRLRGTLPQWIIGQLDAWVERGVYPPSIFLQRVLHNDLINTFRHADMRELMELPDIIAYVDGHLPFDSWGSAEKLHAWSAGFKRVDDNDAK